MLKQIAQAFGFSSVLLLLNYVDLTSAEGDVRFHVARPIPSIALANLLDILIVASIFVGLVWALRKSAWWPHYRLILAVVLPPLLLWRNRDLIPIPVHAWAVLVIAGFWALLLVALRTTSFKVYSGVTRFCGVVLAGFAIFAFVMSFQLAHSMIWRPGPQQIASTAPDPPVDENRPRLVWIIYDELSFDQTFEHRDPSLALPNFDRLQKISTTYSNASPVAYKTAQVVPSLLIGKRVTDLNYSWSNELTIEVDSDWKRFDPAQTLFGFARKNGLKSAVVGWYLPYCPLLNGVVNECYWTNADALESEMTPDATLVQNTIVPLRIMAKQIILPKQAALDEIMIEARAHWNSYSDLQHRALDTIRQGDNDFVFLHMPIPHPPGMYSRHRQVFSPTGSYLGSLALTDQSLGELFGALQASPRWKSTTLIVMGDHSWRVGMWNSRPGWSARNEQLSHGHFDPRPVLLIHRPGQVDAPTIADSYPMLQLHERIRCSLGQSQASHSDCF